MHSITSKGTVILTADQIHQTLPLNIFFSSLFCTEETKHCVMTEHLSDGNDGLFLSCGSSSLLQPFVLSCSRTDSTEKMMCWFEAADACWQHALCSCVRTWKSEKCFQQPIKQRALKNMDGWSKRKLQKQGLSLLMESVRYEENQKHTITNQVCTQRYLTMCDNTAPYTAQEVHLVTTEFKIVINIQQNISLFLPRHSP